MKSFKISLSKSYKRDSCDASVVSLSTQVSHASRSSKSSIASSLAQAKQATTTAWTSLKKGTLSTLRSGKNRNKNKNTTKTKTKTKTPLLPRPRSSLDSPFNDHTYRVDASGNDTSRVSRLMIRLGRRTTYSNIEDSEDENEHEYGDSDHDCGIFPEQPFSAGREQQPLTHWHDEKMAVVVSTEPEVHGPRYTTKTPYTRFDDDAWDL